jgi:hypothetical protein
MSFSIPFEPTVPTTTFFKGDIYPQLRLQTAKFDPLRGYVYEYEWAGANQTLMLPVFQDIINAGMAGTCTFTDDKAVLHVTDSTSEYTIDSWEIHANQEIRDLFSHPAIVQAVNNVVGGQQPSTDVFTALRNAIQNENTIAQLQSNATLTAVLADPTASPLIYDFYNAYRQGTTGYRRQQYVLKHKTNVSNRWQVNVADIGIDQIYTPAQLFTEVTNPASWIFPLPGRLQFKLAAIPVPVESSFQSAYGYLWGWLKSGSTEITEALNRVNIETDYSLDLWDTNIYPAYPNGTNGS